MHPRRVTEPHEAQECLAEVATSGLPLREWARRNGFDARTLAAWHRRLGAPVAPLRLVELVPADTPPPLVLRVGDVEIAVPVGVDTAHLARVLAVVRAC